MEKLRIADLNERDISPQTIVSVSPSVAPLWLTCLVVALSLDLGAFAVPRVLTVPLPARLSAPVVLGSWKTKTSSKSPGLQRQRLSLRGRPTRSHLSGPMERESAAWSECST